MSEDGEGAVVDVGEFFDVARAQERFLEVGGNGDDAVCLHEGDIGNGERLENIFCSRTCAGAAVRRDGDIALLAAEEGELIDDGGDGLIHDGKGGRCARVCMRNGVYIAAVPIDGAVHHQFARRPLSAAGLDGVSRVVDDNDIVRLHLHAVHARRRDADIAALYVADAEIARTMTAQPVAFRLLCIVEYRFFDCCQHDAAPPYP